MQSLVDFTMRRDAADALRERGITGEAAEALLRETAPARHAARVARAVATAREVADALAVPSRGFGSPEEQRDACACLLLVADAAGIGGREGVSGDATARLPAFRELGSGRKQARDGAAWDAALLEALAIVASGRTVTVCVHDTTVAVTLGDGDDAPWGALPRGVGVLPAWQCTLAREGLRRACGLEPWVSMERVPVAWETADTDAANWAAVVNAAEDDLRAESALRALHAVGIEEPTDAEVARVAEWARMAHPRERARLAGIGAEDLRAVRESASVEA